MSAGPETAKFAKTRHAPGGASRGVTGTTRLGKQSRFAAAFPADRQYAFVGEVYMLLSLREGRAGRSVYMLVALLGVSGAIQMRRSSIGAASG